MFIFFLGEIKERKRKANMIMSRGVNYLEMNIEDSKKFKEIN